MTEGPHRDIERFEGWVRPLLPYYPTLEARVLAFEKEGTLWNIYSTLTARPALYRTGERQTVRAHPKFRIWKERLPTAVLLEILNVLRSEELRVSGESIKLATPSNRPGSTVPQVQSPMWWHGSRDWADAGFWAGDSPTGGGVSTYALSSNSGETNALVPREEMEELNDALLRCRPRWLGLPDLIKRFVGARNGFTFNHNTTFSISVPVECHLGAPMIPRPDVLSIPVVAPALLPTTRLKVAGLFSSPTGRSWEREVTTSGPKRKDGDGLGLFTADLPFRGASSVTLHVLLNDQITVKESYTLSGARTPNPREAAFRALGDADGQLSTTIAQDAPTARDSETLEIAVSNLFSVGGFLTLNPGRKHARAGETVDVVAIHPFAPLVYCIECTTGAAKDSAKVRRLHERSLALARVMPDHEVKAVLVVGQEQAPPIEEAECKTLGIMLLTRGHLRCRWHRHSPHFWHGISPHFYLNHAGHLSVFRAA